MTEKLPVFAIVGTAFRLLWQEGHRILPVGAVVTVVAALQQAILLRVEAAPPGFGKSPYFMPVFLVYAALTLPLATSAHRIVLQGEEGRTGLGFGYEEWRYFLGGLRLFGIMMVIGVVVALATAVMAGLTAAFTVVEHVDGTRLNFLLYLVPIAMSVALSFIASRYMLILPAAAIGEVLTLGGARQLIKGNSWRLFFALTIIWGSAYVIEFPLDWLGNRLWAVHAIATGVLYTISTILIAFILSLTYRGLMVLQTAPDQPA